MNNSRRDGLCNACGEWFCDCNCNYILDLDQLFCRRCLQPNCPQVTDPNCLKCPFDNRQSDNCVDEKEKKNQ